MAGTHGCVDSRDGFRYCMLVIYYKAANETIVKHAETKSRLPRTIHGTQNDNRTVIIALYLLMTFNFNTKKFL